AQYAYDEGKNALEAKDAVAAQKAFDQAGVLADKALDVLNEERKKTKEASQNERFGRLLWLKAQILRDGAFTKALADGQPIEPIIDTVTLEKFRSVVQIPTA